MSGLEWAHHFWQALPSHLNTTLSFCSQYSAVQFNVIQCIAMQFKTVQCSAMQFDESRKQCSAVFPIIRLTTTLGTCPTIVPQICSCGHLLLCKSQSQKLANIFQYFDKYIYMWTTRASQSNNVAKGHGIPLKNCVLQVRWVFCSCSILALFKSWQIALSVMFVTHVLRS